MEYWTTDGYFLLYSSVQPQARSKIWSYKHTRYSKSGTVGFLGCECLSLPFAPFSLLCFLSGCCNTEGIRGQRRRRRRNNIIDLGCHARWRTLLWNKVIKDLPVQTLLHYQMLPDGGTLWYSFNQDATSKRERRNKKNLKKEMQHRYIPPAGRWFLILSIALRTFCLSSSSVIPISMSCFSFRSGSTPTDIPCIEKSFAYLYMPEIIFILLDTSCKTG